VYEISEKFFSNNGPVVEYSHEDNGERILRTLIEDLDGAKNSHGPKSHKLMKGYDIAENRSLSLK
jgi:hypothetical protein